jgi:hypothetical protein
MKLAPWIRVVLYAVGGIVAYFFVTSAVHGVKTAIFGDPEVKRAQAGTVVAKEQTKAEANIADNVIQTVHERDVYREHVREVVHDGQGKVNAVDHGQQMDPAIDAAVAAGLCSVHDSLCRGTGAAPVQPVRQPVPGAH